jgi:iron(III) transport system ATP-binding protein
MKILIDHVTKRFGDVTALSDVSLEIEDGELFFLLGPSGCGKTTLLRALAGFGDIDNGQILFDGESVERLPPHRRDTAMVFQGYALWPHMTVAQNVAFGLEMQHLPREDREKRVAAALERVQISELAERRPNELSGGQQQRVALARTLVVEPRCLLLDEPLANLDAKLRVDMRAEIRRLCKDAGLTAVYVTHDQKEALSMADRIAVMRGGRVLQIGRPRELYARPSSTFVAGFISETNLVPGEVASTSDGYATVTTPFGAVPGRVCGSPVATGDRVTLSIRPEIVGVHSGAVEGSVPSTAVHSTYLGEMARHTVELAGRLRLNVCELNPVHDPAPGDVLHLTIPPVDTVVLAE